MGNRRLISTLWFIFDFIIMRLSPVFHLLVFITALTMTRTTLAAAPEIFYPFGSSSGDTINHASDNGGSQDLLLSSFLFFGHRYQQIYVNNNGILTFNQPLEATDPISFTAHGSQDIIAGLWTDFDNRGGGVISYHQYTNGSVLTRATLDINTQFPDLTFNASLVFVATWDKVPYFGMTGTESSFQVVLISNSNSSFILMNYGDIAEPDEPVMAGYETSSTDSFVIPGSTNGSITNLKISSNVDIPGRWALRVDGGPKSNQVFEPAVPTTAEGHLVVRKEIIQTSTSPLTTSASTSATTSAASAPSTSALSTSATSPSTSATSPSSSAPSTSPLSTSATSTSTTSPSSTSASTTLAAAPEIFYPFGTPEADKINPAKDDGSSPVIPLLSSFLFFGRSYQQIYVNNNGFLTFNQSSSVSVPLSFPTHGAQDIIAGLWTDLDNSGGGVISYQQYTTGSVLTRATLDINTQFPDLTFSASLVFVATWDKVPYFKKTGTKTSFQVVLISNSDSSFILMNYGEISVTDEPVVAGYDTISSTDFSVIPRSNLKSSRNVDVPGRWAFRVDGGPKSNQAAPEIFYPFGSSSGDTRNPADDNGGSPVIPLLSSFLFFDRRYQQIYVNNNGFLTFNEPSSAFVPVSFPTYGGQDIIAGLWTDLDNSEGGVISYQQYTTGSVLTRATLDINRQFPDLTFSASLVFVATWDKVPYFKKTGTKTLFQVVLISNSDSSFILMNYGDISVTDEPVVAGYYTISSTDFVIPASTDGRFISNLKSSSNVDVPGRWAFRVDSGPKSNQEIFYPFGSSLGDTRNPAKDNGGSPVIPLLSSFLFFGRRYQQIYVNNNGFLTFNESSSASVPVSFPTYGGQDRIAGLWTDFDNRARGNIVSSGFNIKQ